MFQDAVRLLASRPSLIVQSFLFLSTLLLSPTSELKGQELIRSKKPDRGVYQPPMIGAKGLKKVTVAPVHREQPRGDQDARGNSLVPAPLGEIQQVSSLTREEADVNLPAPIVSEDSPEARTASKRKPNSGSGLVQVDNEQVLNQLQPFTTGIENRTLPQRTSKNVRPTSHSHSTQSGVASCSCESCSQSGGSAFTMVQPSPFQRMWSGESCDDGCCDSVGCDSMGCDGCGPSHCASGKWFGSVELLLMWRQGDRLPPLVTTGPAIDPDTAGQIGEAGTRVLVGEEKILRDMEAGGRLTLGIWLDRYKDRSLVGRGWFVGEDTYGFSADQNSTSVLARPFVDVTDGETVEQNTVLIAFPDRALGSVAVSADTNVFGADISVRQLWRKSGGATIDLLYGYQYMGLNETLGISSTSTSLDDDFAPVGAVISITDAFDVQNDFHGGQVGVASNYREGCWSFASLFKVGFGSLRRKAELRGWTTTSIDGMNASDPNGLLVRSTNAGTHNDDTFSWIPELDLTLGWHKYPAFDVTFGYSLIVMTDALQLSGAIDPGLAVNLADPPMDAQRPAFSTRDGSYYVQGLHFGLSYIY